MRLLVGCLLMLVALVYFQSKRHHCSVSMSVENWFLCVTRGIDLGAPAGDLLSLPKGRVEIPLSSHPVQAFLIRRAVISVMGQKPTFVGPADTSAFSG